MGEKIRDIQGNEMIRMKRRKGRGPNGKRKIKRIIFDALSACRCYKNGG